MSDKKVLIVDDDPDSIFLVENYLSKVEGISTITAENGEQGLEKAKEEEPDLIVLDVQMPGMNGFDVFAELDKNDDTKDIPVIMLTSVAEQTGLGFSAEEMEEYLGKKPEAYFEKPGNADDFRETVSEILGL
jgi:twitching motility two-component system response regulator PilH